MENETQCCHGYGHWLKKTMIVFVIIMLVCGALYLALLARNANKSFDYIGKTAAMQNIISISGEGKVTAVADIAKVQVGLTTDAVTVAKAQEENTNKMNSIIAAVKAAGIAEKDIKTSYYYINPKYDWTKSSTGVIVGYTVSQGIDLKIRDTAKISDILKVAADKGANNIGSLSFDIDEPEQLRDEARIKAIDNAKVKADALASQLGVKLGRIISFSESGGSPGPQPYYDYGMGGTGAVAEKSAPTIQTGENEIIMNVSISYEIL